MVSRPLASLRRSTSCAPSWWHDPDSGGRRIAGVLQAPAGQLARVIGAYAKKDEAA